MANKVTLFESQEKFTMENFNKRISQINQWIVNPILIVKVKTDSVVTVTNNSTILTQTSVDDQVIFDIPNLGTWKISSIYEGIESKGSIDIEQVQIYTTSLIYAKIIINITTGSTVICSKDTESYTKTSENGKTEFIVGDTGSWNIKATLNGQIAETTVEVTESKEYNIDLSYSRIFGVKWDGTASTKWSRTDEAIGFINPTPALNNGSGSSPFDDIMPWAGMVESEDPKAGTLVAIPKFWYKWTAIGNGLKLQIANGKPSDPDFLVSPAHMDRGDGKGERSVVYVGKYHCATDNWKSHTGTTPKNNITRSTARSNIHSLGNDIWQWDWQMHMTIWMLYLVEFADWNCQTAIGYGCGNNSGVENMGKSDNMRYHTGTPYSSRSTYGVGVQYRNIEGLWDNVRDWVDGCYYASNGFNIINNPNNFSDSSNGTSVGTPTSGYPSKFAIKKVNGFQVIYPIESNGSDSTYTCDRWFWSSSSPCLSLGGGYSHSLGHGIGCVYDNGTSSSDASIGPRLQKLP